MVQRSHGVYLAAGRPAITEDTGFGASLLVGEGLLSFSDPRGVLEAIERVGDDHECHSAVALEVAREFFDAERVLADVC